MSSFTANPWVVNPFTVNPWTNPWAKGCNPFDAKPSGAETLLLKLELPAGKTVIVDWGDGGTTDVIGSGSLQDYSHTYAGAGTYPIRMYGDFRYLTRLDIKDVNVEGTIGGLRVLSGLTRFYCYGDNTFSGPLLDLLSGLLKFACDGQNTITGDLVLPSGMTVFQCGGYNTLSGVLVLPSGMTSFQCNGYNTLSGVLALPSGMTKFVCFGLNTISTYTSKTWTTKPVTFIFVPVAPGGLSTAEIDQLLIDFDDDLIWSSGDVITLTGSNEGRSHASAAAVSNMTEEGCTVTTNVLDEAFYFTNTDGTLSPYITVTGSPDILWTWSDGTTDTKANPDDVTCVGEHSLDVSDWDAVTHIRFDSQHLTGVLVTKEWPNAQHIFFRYNDLSGNLILRSWVVCYNLYFNNNNISNLTGSFQTQIKLMNCRFDNNAITSYEQIDKALSDLVVNAENPGRGTTTCSVRFDGGTNSGPSAAGTANKDILVTVHNWTVTLNPEV